MSKFNKLNPMLLTDFYKTIHHLAYVPKMEYLVSYWTPRKSRYDNCDYAVVFGLQGFIKEYLIDYFNENFFNRPLKEIIDEYKRIISNTMNVQASDTTEIEKLHKIGFLPLQIKAVDEGSVVKIRTPIYEFSNTVPGFGWLVNYLETYISVNIWHPINSATVAYRYRQLVDKYFDETVCKNASVRIDGGIKKEIKVDNLNDARSTACGDFSMRGMTGIEGAAKSSAGHLLSFVGTATIGAIPYLEEYYNCDCEKEVVGKGTPSTEHSVMSSYGKDGEFECYRHLIEDVFPDGPLSIVSDTYDYWNVITNYLPKLKDKIMNRNGKIIIRGDSGDPCDIICGTFGKEKDETIEDFCDKTIEEVEEIIKERAKIDVFQIIDFANRTYYVKTKDGEFLVVVDYDYHNNIIEKIWHKKIERTPEEKGTIELLWEIFGGYINDKGYKVLDEHIGAIYGDAITYERAKEIYERLKRKGFAVNNVTLGIGSYTYQCVTRDSLGQALKATNAVINGKEMHIYKDPKTDHSDGNKFKKSQKGMCYVYNNENGDIVYSDEHTIDEINAVNGKYADNLLKTVFKNGIMIKQTSLSKIREKLHNGKF